MSYITIDSSTSSTTVIVFNEKLEVLKRFQKEHRQIITDEGYIEHDLEEIYQNLLFKKNSAYSASYLRPKISLYYSLKID